MDQKAFKQQLLNQLYEPYLQCMRCPLGSLGRTHVVFGEGNPDAQLVFIGEAPGREEDEQGRPFVGRSGKLLNKTLASVGIKREDVFITNIVKCRPPQNRAPLPNESNICKKLLLFNQLKIIRPQIICTLGSIALQSLFEESFQITKIRGKKLEFKEMTIIPTYHPAYVLRNQNAEKDFLADIKQISELIK
ncbi:MAG: uracil-DNA glycosylase [Candidatus Babeliaceae bacterium]